MGGRRLRVSIADGVARAAGFAGPNKFWWQPSSGPISQLLSQLVQKLGLVLPVDSLDLEMGGYVLLRSSPQSLLRDGDVVVLALSRKRKALSPAAADARPAAKRVRREAPAAAAAVAPAAAAVTLPAVQPGMTSSSDDSSSAEEGGSSSSSEANESEVEGGSGSSTDDSSSEGTTTTTSSSEEGDTSSSSGSEAAAPKLGAFATPGSNAANGQRAVAGSKGEACKPSRSARRKAAKRRLRRMGILPGKGMGGGPVPQGTGVNPGAPAAATTAAAATATAGTRQDNHQGRAVAREARRDLALEAAAGADPLNPHGTPAVPGRAPSAAVQQQQEQQQGGGACALVVAAPGRVQPAAQQAPEVVIPAQQWQQAAWQQHSGKKRGRAAAEAAEEAAAVQQASAVQQQQQQAPSAAPEPMPDVAFGVLPGVPGGVPAVGDVVAYKLLEIGPNLAPQVSEVRLGHVASVAGRTLTLEPRPDPAVHPLAYQRGLAEAAAASGRAEGQGLDEEEEDEEEELPSEYDEAGVLITDLSSFVDIRLVDAAAPGSASPAPAAATAPAGAPASKQRAPAQLGPAQPRQAAAEGAGEPSAAAQQSPAAAQRHPAAPDALPDAAEEADVGPSSWAQLGPPKSAPGRPNSGTPITPQGGWASLYAQLQQRRAELSGGKGGGAGAVASPGASPAGLPQANGAKQGSAVSAERPRPRGGVRRTAIGGLLQHLRRSNELDPQADA